MVIFLLMNNFIVFILLPNVCKCLSNIISVSTFIKDTKYWS
ncbi:MAG: hypothetical protein QXS06_04435 [Desulfurococcaceae archaeon]